MKYEYSLPKNIEGEKLADYLLESIDKVPMESYEKTVFAQSNHNIFAVQLSPTGFSYLWKPSYRFEIDLDKLHNTLSCRIRGFHQSENRPSLERILYNVKEKIGFGKSDVAIVI